VYAEAFIGLGSNEGDRLASLAAALRELDSEPGARVLWVSSVYESEPWGGVDQPDYANAVALVSFDGEADALLSVLKRIEGGLGRRAGDRFGPRPIDLDILLFRDEEWTGPELTIPHPRMLERDFVVTPLLEIAPDATLPDGTAVDGRRAREGRVTGVLGSVAGFEEISGPRGEPVDEPAAARPMADLFAPSGTGPSRVGRWVAVGPGRYEAGAGNTGTEFHVLMYEAFLKEAGIPVRFYPHRPNETMLVQPGLLETVRLMVPEERESEARRLIEDLDRSVPEEGSNEAEGARESGTAEGE
jgi:2-amino-4-hydroxy-6-hydroxymethyldihydropteridine diphosphokinase